MKAIISLALRAVSLFCLFLASSVAADEPLLLDEFEPIFSAILDETHLNSCPMKKAEGEKVCSRKENGETDYEWMRRVQKAATESARAKFKKDTGSELCPDENGSCLRCRGSGPMKKGTCEKFPTNQTKPSEVPGTRSTTHDDETDEICSQVTVGCSYKCVVP